MRFTDNYRLLQTFTALLLKESTIGLCFFQMVTISWNVSSQILLEAEALEPLLSTAMELKG